MIGRALLIASLAVTVVACDGDDGEADVTEWCAQLDVAVTAGVAVEDLGSDDPGAEDALADVQVEMAALGRLEPPPEIADDWAIVSGPPPTNATGGFELGGDWAAAGQRVAAWALDECELSTDARESLEDDADG